MTPSLTGTQLGPYRLDEEIGRGGMGVVYRAEEVPLHRAVAVKLLAPRLTEDAKARARFQQEIKTAIAIEHPHVVPVYNAGYEEGYFFLAMRLVRGKDLWRLIQSGGPLPERRALRLIGQIAGALFACHEQHIVHRDVKPQNVLVWNAEQPDEHAFLTDFGIAKALDDARITQGVVGTRGYMAPELLNWQPATPAADQFSLACLAYELLSGELPFADEASLEPVDYSSPFPLTLHVSGISKRLRETIERALSPNPADRFSDIRAFVMADGVAAEAFETSRLITDTMSDRRSDSELVTGLHTQLGLSLERIAEITDLERSEVVRLRRRAARRSIVGE
jgi:serine/threonine protein kinase